MNGERILTGGFYIAAGIAAGIVVVELLNKVVGINLDASDPDNDVATAVDKVVKAVTFDEDATLGNWLFEKINGTYDPNDMTVTAESWQKTFPNRPLPDNVLNASLGRPQYTAGGRY